jgi:DNA/RNA endonuclease YhcR with UshA esterase domain
MITVLIWDSVLATMLDETTIQPGAAIRVSGQVNEFNGELEIIPSIGGDVRLG